jgi:signal transduction histidine kinase
MGKPRLRDGVPLVALAIALAVARAPNGSGPNGPRAEVIVCFSLFGLVWGAYAIWRRPLLGFALCAVVALVDPSRAAVALPLVLAIGVVALSCEDRRVTAATALVAVVLLADVIGSPEPFSDRNLRPLVPWTIAVGLAVAAGLYLAARRAYVDSLRERAAQLERERALLAEQAVADERVRIARELHDVVAHGVSLMVVQAQALGALDGEERERATARIASVGREALAEMHTMLGVLRPEDGGEPSLAPVPGVRDVPALVEGARSTGLDVALVLDGEPAALPAGVDLSAYRIVQEALTNVIKHARALRTEVRLRYLPEALELTVTDDGPGGGEESTGGHGLLGMRERVALFGGTLETGRRADEPGYEVHAVLPL